MNRSIHKGRTPLRRAPSPFSFPPHGFLLGCDDPSELGSVVIHRPFRDATLHTPSILAVHHTSNLCLPKKAGQTTKVTHGNNRMGKHRQNVVSFVLLFVWWFVRCFVTSGGGSCRWYSVPDCQNCCIISLSSWCWLSLQLVLLVVNIVVGGGGVGNDHLQLVVCFLLRSF